MNFIIMREFFLKDLRWKLFSLLLAVTIWVTVHKVVSSSGISIAANSDHSKVFNSDRPVLVIAATAGAQLYHTAPETVKVTVTGAAEAIDDLRANQIRATVDLTDFQAQKDSKCSVDVSVPLGITVIAVDPPKVSIITPPTQ
jgi:YbbR domain-containing protein